MTGKYSKYILSVCFTFTSLFMSHSIWAKEGDIRSLDGIAAVVNNDVITQSQITSQRNILKAQQKHSEQPKLSDAQLNQKVLQNLIDMQLIIQEAKKDKLSISDVQLDQTLGNIAAQNNMNVDQLKKAVTAQGFNWPDYREHIRNQALANEVENQALATKVKVTDAEISDFLKTKGASLKNIEEYHLQGLLVPMPQSPTTNDLLQGQQQAFALILKINDVNDLAAFAKTQTTMDGAPLQGGDLGWRPLAAFPPPLLKDIKKIKAGVVLGPIASPVGYYIFKVTAERKIPFQHMTDTYNLRHIMLKTDAVTNDAATKAKLEKLRSQLIKGADFKQFAALYSQDATTASKGGELGWMNLNSLPAAYAEIIMPLKPNEISQPFQTPAGWELLQVLGHKKLNDTQAYINNFAKSAIYQQKFEPLLQAWLKELQAKAYIKIFNK